MLAAWAAATSDIRLGMLVSNIIYLKGSETPITFTQ